MNRLRILSGSVLLALAPLAMAQTTTTPTAVNTEVQLLDTTAANRGQTQVATRIASSFTILAGSEDNALALVRALRSGTSVTLTTPTSGTAPVTGTTPASGTAPATGTSPGTVTTTPLAPTATSFTPPTGTMGWGNVKIALALAQDALARAGITTPTAAQLQAALMGGVVTRADGTTVTMKGVLQLRADGMGWGQIAQAQGTKLGPVVSSLKATHVKVAALPPSTSTKSSAAVPLASKGVTSAADSTPSATKSSKGLTTAGSHASSSASRGLVTAEGATAGGGANAGSKGHAYGRGMVTAAGGGASASVAATAKPTQGAGMVSAAGGSAAGVTTAQGHGNGPGNEHGKGKGKPGG